jgi:hypothetical protein
LIFTIASPFAEGIKSSRFIATYQQDHGCFRSVDRPLLEMAHACMVMNYEPLSALLKLEAISTLSAKNDDDVKKYKQEKRTNGRRPAPSKLKMLSPLIGLFLSFESF